MLRLLDAEFPARGLGKGKVVRLSVSVLTLSPSLLNKDTQISCYVLALLMFSVALGSGAVVQFHC